MPAALNEIEPLLAPLRADTPSGPDLVYDPQFQALGRAAAGKPERQYGSTIYPAEPPEWRAVMDLALPLAEQTRDLRVAMWLLRAGARLNGFVGALRGLQLLQGLAEQLWHSVHPQLDASDGDDPTMRLNALAPLLANDAALADWRSAALIDARNSMRLRDLELAFGAPDVLPGETIPTEAGVLKALAEMCNSHPQLPEQLRAAHDTAQRLASQVEAAVGTAQAPDFAPLVQLLACPVKALGQLRPGNATAPGADSDTSPAQAANPGTPLTAAGKPTLASRPTLAGAGAIASRADAVRELDRVCAWIEVHEPSNPAPLLLRRAQRLMNKSFIDIIRDLAPDGLTQVESIAGTAARDAA